LNLYIDLGNSRIRFAADSPGKTQTEAFDYTADTLPSVYRQYSHGLQTPARVLVANVAGERIGSILTTLCQSEWSLTPEFLRAGRTRLGVTTAYSDPARLGVDRWLAVVAAWNKYRDNLCVIDCGSAVTVDLVSADGQHNGGYIIPGSYMMQQSLLNSTGQITLTSAYSFSGRPGQSTEECVYNGTTCAVAAFIEYIVQSVNETSSLRYQNVITGGGAGAIMDLLKIEYRHDPGLVIEGLRLTGAV